MLLLLVCRCADSLRRHLHTAQVGTGDRSEKIKTYNYKDSRCSDHRLKQNYDLNKVLDGEIDDSIQGMISADQQEQLKELADSLSSTAAVPA